MSECEDSFSRQGSCPPFDSSDLQVISLFGDHACRVSGPLNMSCGRAALGCTSSKYSSSFFDDGP